MGILLKENKGYAQERKIGNHRLGNIIKTEEKKQQVITRNLVIENILTPKQHTNQLKY